MTQTATYSHGTTQARHAPTSWKKAAQFVIVLALAGVAWKPIPPPVALAERIRITRVDTSGFPKVVVQFVARDPAGIPLRELQRGSLRISENGREMPIEALGRAECGLRLVFLVDVGDGVLNTGVRLDEVFRIARRHMLEFAIGRPWMDVNLDEVAILAQEGVATRQVMGFSGSPASIEAALSAYLPPTDAAFARAPAYGDFSREGLSEALDLIEFSPDDLGRNAQILLFTPGARADLAPIARRALELDIPIHVHLSRTTETRYWEEALQPLAAVTHGRYSTEVEEEDLGSLFLSAAQERSQYRLTYRSTSGELGTRHVVLETPGLSSQIQAATDYEVSLEAPTLDLQPDREEIVREGRRGPGGWEGEPSFMVVPFHVDWPDGYARRIVVAQLLVDRLPIDEGQIQGDSGSFTWDVRSYTAWTTTPVILQAEIQDELGMRAASPPLTIGIRYRPVSFFPGGERWMLYGALALSGLALVASVTLVAGRKRWVPAFHEAEERLIDFVERVTGRRAAPLARARLQPLQGFDPPLPASFELYGTTAIGRSRRHADLLFHLDDENSPISRLHCTLLDEDDHFRIRDEASSNGTFLNGERLAELEPRVLSDGDIIDLAPLERGGLRLRFMSAGSPQLAELDHEDLRITRPRSKGAISRPEVPEPAQRFGSQELTTPPSGSRSADG